MQEESFLFFSVEFSATHIEENCIKKPNLHKALINYEYGICLHHTTF